MNKYRIADPDMAVFLLCFGGTMNEDAIDSVVDSFEKNKHEFICVGVNEWRNEIQFYIRTFVPTEDGDGILPTKKGISLPIEKFSELLSGLRLLGEGLREEKIVARIRKSPNQEVRVGSQHYRGIPMVYIRIFSKYGEDNTFKPTKRGVSLRVEKYPELLNAVEKLEKEIQFIYKGEIKQNTNLQTPAQAKKEKTIRETKKLSQPIAKHKKPQQSKSKRQETRNRKRRRNVCPYCDMTFTRAGFRKHMDRFHSEPYRPPVGPKILPPKKWIDIGKFPPENRIKFKNTYYIDEWSILRKREDL